MLVYLDKGMLVEYYETKFEEKTFRKASLYDYSNHKFYRISIPDNTKLAPILTKGEFYLELKDYEGKISYKFNRFNPIESE